MMEVAEKIKKVRELKNFTQEHMAKTLGMSQAGYSKIESGNTEITLTKLNDIAKALDVQVEDLLAFDSQKYFNSYNNNVKGNNNGVVINPDLGEFKKLYEDKIMLLEKLLERTESDLSRYRDRYGDL